MAFAPPESFNIADYFLSSPTSWTCGPEPKGAPLATLQDLAGLIVVQPRQTLPRMPAEAEVSIHLLRNGADIRDIQLLMGHASLSSTEAYLGIEKKDLDRMIETSHPRERVE